MSPNPSNDLGRSNGGTLVLFEVSDFIKKRRYTRDQHIHVVTTMRKIDGEERVEIVIIRKYRKYCKYYKSLGNILTL